MTREEAIDNLEWLRCEVYNEDSDGSNYAEAIDMAIEALSIVRCKDCYHYDKGENESESWQYCRFLRHNTSDDEFCSWAERREP